MTNQCVISYMVDYRPYVCCYLSLFSIKTSDRAFTPLFNKIIISVPKSTTYLRSVPHSNICICIFPEVLWRHILRSVGILYDLDVIGTHPLHSSSQMPPALEALLLSEGREGKREDSPQPVYGYLHSSVHVPNLRIHVQTLYLKCCSGCKDSQQSFGGT